MIFTIYVIENYFLKCAMQPTPPTPNAYFCSEKDLFKGGGVHIPTRD